MKKLLIDFFPLLVFFIAFRVGDIFTATAAAIGATFIQMGYLKLSKTPIEPLHWLGLGVVIVFGGLTLYLRDETFIKWKPTIYNWVFASVMIIGKLVMKRNLLKSLLKSQLELPDHAWDRLIWMWSAFFIFMGALNLFIAYRFPTEQWVNFKVWWSMGLWLLFSIAQGVYMSKHMKQT
jgi:intracellular septation protein